MRSAVGRWIATFVVVDVDPADFDGPDFPRLLERLDKHFMMTVSVTTPDWESDSGVRVAGAYCPVDLLIDQNLVWRKLELPPDPDDLPF